MIAPNDPAAVPFVVDLVRVRGGSMGFEGLIQRVQFVLSIRGGRFFDVVNTFEGMVADQVEKELGAVQEELVQAAAKGDQVAITKIGRDAMTRALETLNGK